MKPRPFRRVTRASLDFGKAGTHNFPFTGALHDVGKPIEVAYSCKLIAHTPTLWRQVDLRKAVEREFLYTVPQDRLRVLFIQYVRISIAYSQVSTLQGEILRKFGYLREAAIPVQDLHLTLFVATLLEEDGTLQVTCGGPASIAGGGFPSHLANRLLPPSMVCQSRRPWIPGHS